MPIITLRTAKVFLVAALLAMVLAAPAAAARRSAGAAHEEPPGGPPAGEPAALSAVPCSGGFAGPYPCHHLDLAAFVPRTVLGAGPADNLNDIWGWTDPVTGHEIALVGLANGLSFVDVTVPEEPVVLGILPTNTVASIWRGVKVYRDHAYVVADRAGNHGMQVFDLAALRIPAPRPTTFAPTAVYYGAGFGLAGGSALGSSHNVAINEERGFAYVTGSNTCNGGLHIADLADPARPRFAGCFSDDGYSHDVQCVVYRGPDTQHRGREICMASNEDTLTVVDATDARRPQMLSRSPYPGAAYSHQGWFTEDQRWFLMNDELDEQNTGQRTRTYVWDVADLDAPRLVGAHTHATRAIDHNLFVVGDMVYEANYTAGLRILRLADPASARLEEVAYFDVYPQSEAPVFEGAWMVYPFFASGTLVVTGIDEGLFVLRPGAGHD